MVRLIRLTAIMILVGLTLAACAGNQVTAEEVMERMQTARDNFTSGYTVAEVSLNSPERSGNFTVESWAKKTDQTDAAGRPITKLRTKVLAASGGDHGDDLVGTEMVNDGETFWLYNPAENKVLTGNLSEIRSGDVGAQDPAAQMLQMQEMLQRIIDGSDVTIVSDSEDVAGRDTRQVKLTPKPETQQQLQLGSVIDTTLWIDKASDLPVKAVIDARDLGRLEATATQLDLATPIGDETFVFTPPPGAEIIDAAELARRARPSTTTLEDARAQASFPVLAPETLPAGVQLDEVQQLNMRGETIIQNYSGAFNFSLVQGRDGVPSADQAPQGAQTQTVTVRGQEATLISSGAGEQQGTLLRWEENGVTIVVAGTLSAEQATAIAESLR